MKVLFLDDSTERCKAFRSHIPSATIVHEASYAIMQLKASVWDAVLLDHDLGGEEYVDSSHKNTGMEVVRWIEENHPKVGGFVVHSCNASARVAMAERLYLAGYNAVSMPWTVGADRIAFFVQNSPDFATADSSR